MSYLTKLKSIILLFTFKVIPYHGTRNSPRIKWIKIEELRIFILDLEYNGSFKIQLMLLT
jgi:hypothetical protein